MRAKFIALAAVLSLLPVAAVAQRGSTNVPPTPKGPTPRTADGHPDLTGLWAGGKGGAPNWLHAEGIAISSDTHTVDTQSGETIITYPVPEREVQDFDVRAHTAELLHRIISNLPLYKPEYWDKVNKLDLYSNREDPEHNCMPSGIPRAGIPNYIGQFPNYLIFIYGGQPAGGAYRMIPTDGRKHTAIDDVDPSYLGEGIGHWEGDTLVVDTIGFTDDSWLQPLESGGGGFFHSDNMHVIEKFHRDGNTLTWTATVDDPDVLLEPWTMPPVVGVLNGNPKAMLRNADPCSDREISHSVGTERH